MDEVQYGVHLTGDLLYFLDEEEEGGRGGRDLKGEDKICGSYSTKLFIPNLVV